MGLVTFRDARRVEWQVCEVSRTQIDAQREHREAERRLRGRRAPWSLLPGLDEGWLSFESWSQKRRLTPYPADWRELQSDEAVDGNEAHVVGQEQGLASDQQQQVHIHRSDHLTRNLSPALWLHVLLPRWQR